MLLRSPATIRDPCAARADGRQDPFGAIGGEMRGRQGETSQEAPQGNAILLGSEEPS
jgi:hypothetical protein